MTKHTEQTICNNTKKTAHISHWPPQTPERRRKTIPITSPQNCHNRNHHQHTHAYSSPFHSRFNVPHAYRAHTHTWRIHIFSPERSTNHTRAHTLQRIKLTRPLFAATLCHRHQIVVPKSIFRLQNDAMTGAAE